MGLLLSRTPKIYPDRRLPNYVSAHVLFRLTTKLSRVCPWAGLGSTGCARRSLYAAVSGKSLSYSGANTVGERVCRRQEGHPDSRVGTRTLTGKHMCPVTVTRV